jgi:HEAT repeat protein
MQVEDEQWVVRNAATQALEELQRPNPNIPKPLPPLHESPWLIAFAGERGLGLTSGKPARELLLRALKEGSIEERLAAMEYLHQSIDQGMLVEIYNLQYGEEKNLREAAYNLLWHLDLGGIELPSPVQFGLGYA